MDTKKPRNVHLKKDLKPTEIVNNKYYKEWEQKVANLEIEVSKLKYQNEQLEHQLKNKQDGLGKLIEDENYFGQTLPKILDSYPDQS